MWIKRLPAHLILTAFALLFCTAGILTAPHPTVTISALLILQAICLAGSLNYPRITTILYVVSFLVALGLGHSTGIEIFLGIFLIAAVTATGQKNYAIPLTLILILGGFYSPQRHSFDIEPDALLLSLLFTLCSYAAGHWIHVTAQRHAHEQHIQQQRHQDLTSLLHDTIAADLTSVIVQLEKLAITTPQRTTELQHAAHTARDALTRTRQLLATINTHPNTTATTTLPVTLDRITTTLRTHDFTVNTHIALNTPVPHALHNTALDRCLTEAATNIIKYGTPASAVTITAESNPQGVTITIVNTHPATKETLNRSTHLGISNMAHTLHAIGGELTITTNDQEWVTTMHIPF